jgi:plastocyanin
LKHRSKAASAAAVAVLAVVPAGASAATKVVLMGTPPTKDGKAIGKLFVDVNDFFPNGTTIHVGDKVQFTPVGFHNADLPKKGGAASPLLVPTGQPVTGLNDAAGNPFWFNGAVPQVSFNPVLGKSNLGKTLSYSGSKGINSGLPPENGKPKPMTVKFTKTGTFAFYCDIHPGMKGSVRVLAKSKKIPSAKADAKRLKDQVARDLAIAKTLPKAKPAAGTVDVGEAGKFGVEYFGMLPATQTVPVGTTLKFQMTAGTREVHTATFGPGDPEKEPNSYLGQLAAAFLPPIPRGDAVYPSDPPPAGPAALTPTLHGNGFWNSGALDLAGATPLPASNVVTFAAPGTYNFYCLVHPFMKGTVVVQ